MMCFELLYPKNGVLGGINLNHPSSFRLPPVQGRVLAFVVVSDDLSVVQCTVSAFESEAVERSDDHDDEVRIGT